MPRFAGVPVDNIPTAKKPRFGGVAVEARESTQPKASGPDFSKVSARTRSTEEDTGLPTVPGGFNRRQYEAEARLARQQAEDPLEGTSTFNRLAGSLGKTFADAGRGIVQAGTDSVFRQAAMADDALSRMGADGARNQLRERVGRPLYEASQRQRQETGERRRLEAPISYGSPAGVVGNIAGNALQAIGPGQLAKGTVLAGTLNPATGKGNALAGGLYGALQPYEDGGEQALNALAGAGGGALGAGVAKGAGKIAARLASGRLTGAERAAGRVFLGTTDAGRKIDIQESRVPGVRRTLGDATGDTRIQAIERNQRRTDDSGRFGRADAENNEARIRALEGIAGDDTALSAAKLARSNASDPFYSKAQTASVQIGPEIKGIIERLPASVLSKAKQLAAMEGSKTASTPGAISGGDLHYIKLALDDEIGKVGPGSMGNTERALAMRLKEDFLGEVSKQIPDYDAGLKTFAGMSGPVNRMQVGRQVIKEATGEIPDQITGVMQLQPNKFSRVFNNLDEVAKRATKFKASKAQNIFQPQDMDLLRNMQDDMTRQASRASNRAQAGSATMEATDLLKRGAIKGAVSRYGQKLPMIGPIIEVYDAAKTNMLRDKLSELLTDTAYAKKVLDTLSVADRKLVRSALVQLSGKVGMFAPNLSNEASVEIRGGGSSAPVTEAEIQRLRAEMKARRAKSGQ